MRSTGIAAVYLLLTLLGFGGTRAAAQPVADHLKCFKVKDSLSKKTYTADLDGLVPQNCVVKVPAKMACVPTGKTNVIPMPPGGGGTGTPNSFFCYKVKCPKTTLPTISGTDQFGTHTATAKPASLVCAPVAPAGTTTSTTTTPVSTTTSTTGGCISDNQPCSTNASCCSQTCTGGTCAPLSNACLTLGNACTQNSACCSQLCQGGTCSVSSFCRQTDDICSVGSDCCSGTCTIASGASVGTCAAVANGAANCSGVDGTVCDATAPCGASCCSGLCAPYAPTGVAVCQPSSGCHVTGDSCTQDSDCCGSAGLPGGSGTPVTCAITPPATTGFCRVPQGCEPDGEVCKLASQSCNASCDCCSGNCLNVDTCKPDEGGVARCTATACVPTGGACASSANCCDTTPCVPNPSGTPPFVCAAPTTCTSGNSCQHDADCCAGTRCILPTGLTIGTCTTCNASGQACTADTDCCAGTRCALAAGSTQGTCTQ